MKTRKTTHSVTSVPIQADESSRLSGRPKRTVRPTEKATAMKALTKEAPAVPRAATSTEKIAATVSQLTFIKPKKKKNKVEFVEEQPVLNHAQQFQFKPPKKMHKAENFADIQLPGELEIIDVDAMYPAPVVESMDVNHNDLDSVEVLPQVNDRPSPAAIMQSLGITNMAAEDYLPSPQDRVEMVSVKRVTVIVGRWSFGLFAELAISKGAIIGEYMGERMSLKKLEKQDEDVSNYFTRIVNDDLMIDAKRKGNFTRFINHSESQPNVSFVTRADGGHIDIVALRDIKPGEQLLANYGSNYLHLDFQFFLNPSDNNMNAADTYHQYKNYYYQKKFRFKNEPALGVDESELYQITNVCYDIRHGKLLASHYVKLDPAILDLPCIAYEENDDLFNFNEKDTFTALMLACAMGDFNNVVWLCEQGVNINLQRTYSGLNALGMALNGSSDSNRETERLALILYLIRHGASVLQRDRTDMNFVYKAVKVLCGQHFEALLMTLKHYNHAEFELLPRCLDQDKNDIVMYVLTQGDIHKFVALMKVYGDKFTGKFDDELFVKRARELIQKIELTEIEEAKVDIKAMNNAIGTKLLNLIEGAFVRAVEENVGGRRTRRKI